MTERDAGMGSPPTVAGVSGHNGWAVFVCITARGRVPVVLDRRRVELIGAGLPNQPYEHDTLDLNYNQAEALVREVRESAVHCAERALVSLRSSGEIAALAMREPLLPHLPESVAAAHASSWVTVRADPMIYHEALCKAASALGIAVELIARDEESRRAAEGLSTTPERLDRWLAELRVSLGAPWQKDHREAAARAIAALAGRAEITFPANGRAPERIARSRPAAESRRRRRA